MTKPNALQSDSLPPSTQPQRWAWLSLFIVAIAGFAVFVPSLSHPFVYDDQPAVRDNPVVQGESPWIHVLTKPYWPADMSPDPIYRPVTTASLRLDAAVFGADPRGYHMTNALLHGAVAALVAMLTSLVVGTSNPTLRNHRWIAGTAAGLLFALHPVHTEAVALIVGRSELLAALFMLLTVWMHWRWTGARAALSVRRHILLAIMVLMSCLSKEHGVFVVFPVAVVDGMNRPLRHQMSPRIYLQRLARSHWLGIVIVMLLFFTARWLVFGWKIKLPLDLVVDTLNPLDTATTTEKLLTPFALLTHSLRLMILPMGHSPNWGAGSFELASRVARWDVLFGGIVLIVAVIGSLRLLRQGKPTAIPLVALLALLLIPGHFLPVANWFFGERWLYAPSAFLTLFLVISVGRRVKLMTAVAVPVIVLLAYQTWQYQRCFASNPQLMACVLEQHPNDYFALSATCQRHAVNGSILEVEDEVMRLTEHHAEKGDTWCFHAVLLAEKGDYEQAAQSLKKCMTTGGFLRGAGGIRDAAERINARRYEDRDATSR